MKVYKLKKRDINLRDYVKRTALENDADVLIDHDAVVVDKDTGEVRVIYKLLPSSQVHKEAFRLLETLKFAGGNRIGGLKNPGQTKIFGHVPRNRLKTVDQACRISRLALQQPEIHAKLIEYAKVISDVYRDNDPDRFTRHQELTKKVNNNYVIPGTLFTSGIVNKNNPLKYHYDSGNFTSVASAMIAFRHDVDGGHLCLPPPAIPRSQT